jgi:hypothetical protein
VVGADFTGTAGAALRDGAAADVLADLAGFADERDAGFGAERAAAFAACWRGVADRDLGAVFRFWGTRGREGALLVTRRHAGAATLGKSERYKIRFSR